VSANNGVLNGKTALVTGASRNLGAVIAQRLADEGGTVAVNYNSSAEAAEKLVERLAADGGRRHLAVQADVTRSADIRRLVETCMEAFGGRIDILVNNAGPFSMTPFSKLPESEWDHVWDANVKAAYLASQLVAPPMKSTGWGRIINISAASYVLRNHSIYGLAKEALIFLTEELAVELGPEVTVNAVAPGQILESADDIAEFDPTFVERAITATPLARLVTRHEVADVVVGFCRPEGAALTGVTVPIDGGFRLRSF
jgi:NAD(P)-dependent dehydrogenase (short-subunit alcohol dehydrogenase family)